MNNVPKLRFKEFSGEYIEYRLSELMKRYSEKNSDNAFNIEDILSLSSIHGIVDRKELLEDTYSKVNHTNYLKTKLHDFVYGKSISASYPYGLFKVNNCRDGLLSTLYFTFRTFENVSPQYLDKYFSHLNRANNFLKKYVLVGDRYITADSNYILSGKIFIPVKQEQQKIASFLTSIDTKIEQLTKKEELLKQYKKGVMQKIFSQEIRFRADDGGEFSEWEDKKLGDVFTRIRRKNNENNQNVLTISAEYGLINQKKFFNKSVAAKDVTGYYLLEKGDFAYNKSYSNGYPMGAIKKLNNYDKGVVSTLYICFRVNSGYDESFYEKYFDSGFVNRELHKIAQEGARNHGLLNMSVVEFFNDIKIPVPSNQEQTKIANFLSSIDSKIEQAQKQLNVTKEFKKALLQQMFV